MNAFDIYIEYASVKGEMTEKWLAEYSAIILFYAAYSIWYKYKKIINVASTAGSGTKENAFVTATTPY